MLNQPDLAAQHGATYLDAVERFLATEVRAAQQSGDVAADLDATTVAAGLLALTNGLGSSALGGQRDGAAALRILTYHLDRLFQPTGSGGPPAATGNAR